MNLLVHFSETEIEAAKRLRRRGLSGKPIAGHYLYDESGICKQPSPFQEKVNFVLNHPYFMGAVGGVERFEEIMLWLATWDDLREVRRDYGASDVDVTSFLNERRAIESGQERLTLCELVESCLPKAATPPAIPCD